MVVGLQRQAQLHPERPAFYWQDKSWSFAALQKEVTAYACYYEHRIPQTIERVAILSNKSPEMYFTILALWELGKQIQFLNTRLTEKELYYQLTDAACQWGSHQSIAFLADNQVPAFWQIARTFFFCADFDLPKNTSCIDHVHFWHDG